MRKISVDNQYIKIWIEDGIVFSFYKPNLQINLEIAKQLVLARQEASEGIARPLFIDISNLISVDLEAREYLAGEQGVQLITAGAIYTSNPISKFVGKLFLYVNKPQKPSKIFSSKKEAIEWLQEYK